MVVAGGTDSIDIVADSDSAAHMVVVAHTEADSGSDTDWVGTVQANTMLAPFHPESAHHSSSSMCRPSFPSRVGMVYNPSLHALLAYKIYRTSLRECLKYFASIKIPCRGVF